MLVGLQDARPHEGEFVTLKKTTYTFTLYPVTKLRELTLNIHLNHMEIHKYTWFTAARFVMQNIGKYLAVKA